MSSLAQWRRLGKEQLVDGWQLAGAGVLILRSCKLETENLLLKNLRACLVFCILFFG